MLSMSIVFGHKKGFYLSILKTRKPFMKLIYGKWYTKEIYTFLFVIKKDLE